MEFKIKRLSTNRFKINGVVYKRVRSKPCCYGCYFHKGPGCRMPDNVCLENGKAYHMIPNEL